MAMDLIHQVEQVKQKLEGALFNITVDVNQIYEELEQHRVREDRVDFVASLFLNRFGVNSCTDIAGTNSLPADVSLVGNASGKQDECDVLPAGVCEDGTLFDDEGEQFGLQADVNMEMEPCNSKVDSSKVNKCEKNICPVPGISGISSAVNFPSSSNYLRISSPARLDFDYDVNNNDPNNNTEYEMPHDSVSSSNNSFPTASAYDQDDYFNDEEFSDQEHIREKLLSEVRVIHTVVPKRTFGEIYSFLESNLDNVNRLQVVMKYFLNQDFPNVETTIDEEINTNSNPEPHHAEQVGSVEKSKEVDNCETVKVNTTQEIPTIVVADANTELQDGIILSDDETESEPEVVYLEENHCEVMHNGKRQSQHKTEASPPKKSKTSCLTKVNNEESVVLDLSLNCTVFPSSIHKHFSAVKEMFPNLKDRHLVNVCSAFGETDDDLPRIVEELLQTVNNLENLCDPLLEPVPVFEYCGIVAENALIPYSVGEKEGMLKSALPELLEAQHAEQGQKCVAVFQQACSVLLPSSSRSAPSLVDGIAQPISNIPDCVDDDSSSCSSSCVAVETQPNKSMNGHINSVRKLANHGEGTGNTDKAASSNNTNSSVVTAIVAASCAEFTAETLAGKKVNFGTKGKSTKGKSTKGKSTKGKSADNSRCAVPKTKPNSAVKLPSHAEGTSNIDEGTSSVDEAASSGSSNSSEVTAVVASFTGPTSEARAGKTVLNIETETELTGRHRQLPHPVTDNSDRKRDNTTLMVQNLKGDGPSLIKRKRRAMSAEVITQGSKSVKDSINQFVAKAKYPTNGSCYSKNNSWHTDPKTSRVDHNDAGEVVASTSIDSELSIAEPDIQEQQKTDDRYECLLSIFPQADPTYLLDKCIEIGNDEEKMRLFIADALEKKNYPSYQEYQERMEVEKQKKKVTTEFSVESFLEKFPDPLKYFLEQKKPVNMRSSMAFLKNRYPRTRISDIITTFKSCKYNLTKTSQTLDKLKAVMKVPRSLINGPGDKVDLKFLQEVAFIENRALIEKYIKKKKLEKKKAFEEAKARKELVECGCCFSDEVLIDDIGTCNEGHLFCGECIRRSAEVQIGDGKTTFPCLTTCESEFSLKTLQKFLKASMLSRVLQARQMEEVKAAGIEGIEFCPYCNFATILSETDKVFHCLNPECMKETCRICKEPNHVPQRCDEVEKPDEVKARTYIENKMTEALVRVCWKCKKAFIKEDGCNKMTCSCGAVMCYICRQRVTDYLHFNGQGGTDYHKCPLYSTNDELHVEVVKREAMRAKEEIMQQNPNVRLKNDPTKLLPKPTHSPAFPGYPRRFQPLYQGPPFRGFPVQPPLPLPPPLGRAAIAGAVAAAVAAPAVQQQLHQLGERTMANVMHRLHDRVRNYYGTTP